MLALPLLFAYALVVAATHRRWDRTGVVVASLMILLADVARGTFEWWRPHQDWAASRRFDWACHATGAPALLLVLTPGVLLALHLFRDHSRSLWEQMAVVVVACLVLALPTAFVILWWGVGVLACDTL